MVKHRTGSKRLFRAKKVLTVTHAKKMYLKVQKHEKIFTWRQAMKNIQTTACTKNNQTMISIDKHVIPGKCLGTSIGRRARENIQTAEN